jgi:hypothetical protein
MTFEKLSTESFFERKVNEFYNFSFSTNELILHLVYLFFLKFNYFIFNGFYNWADIFIIRVDIFGSNFFMN